MQRKGCVYGPFVENSRLTLILALEVASRHKASKRAIVSQCRCDAMLEVTL